MRSLLVKSALVAVTALAFAGAASAQSPYGDRRGGGSGYGQGSGSGYGQPSYRGPAAGGPVVVQRPIVVGPPVYVGGPRPPVYVPGPGYGPGYGHGPRPGFRPYFGRPAPWQVRRWHRWHGPRYGW